MATALLWLTTACDESQEEAQHTSADGEVQFGVLAAEWQDALSSTRAHTRTGNDLTVAESDYPDKVFVYTDVTNYSSTPFVIVRGSAIDDDTPNYYAYHTAQLSADDATEVQIMSKSASGWNFTAWSAMPTATDWSALAQLPAFATTCYLKSDATQLSGRHVLFTLRHQQAAVRLCLKEVDELRYFRLTQLTVTPSSPAGSAPITVVDDADGWLIPNASSFDAAAFPLLYVSGSEARQEVTFTATYNVYDAGPDGIELNADDQLTRSDVTVSNKATLSFGTATEHPFPTIGYYYDLKITLNPDFLYVLSDNDDPASGLIIE